MSAYIKFEDLNINPSIIDALYRYKISNFIQILTTPSSELVRITKLSLKEILILRTSIINAILLPKPITALSNFKKEFLITGCNEIDIFLKGGIVPSWLTEISGESSSGKTQFCLQLCLTVQLVHEKYGAIYISTENTFPSKRLNQMYERLIHRCPSLQNQSFMDQILIMHSATLEELEDCVNTRVQYLLEYKNIKLIVVDSIAAIARSEFFNEVNKKKLLVNRICSKLYKMAALNNIFVVLINQVTDKFDQINDVLIRADSNIKIPALGPSWAHWIHMRLQIFRTNKFISLPLYTQKYSIPNQCSKNCYNIIDDMPQNSVSGKILSGNNDLNDQKEFCNSKKFYNSNVRELRVLSAPHLPQSCINFFIDADGIKYIKI